MFNGFEIGDKKTQMEFFLRSKYEHTSENAWFQGRNVEKIHTFFSLARIGVGISDILTLHYFNDQNSSRSHEHRKHFIGSRSKRVNHYHFA